MDFSNNLLLRDLWCSNNQLITLDLDSNTELISLHIDGNDIQELDLSQNCKLGNERLDGYYRGCGQHPFAQIYLADMPNLQKVILCPDLNYARVQDICILDGFTTDTSYLCIEGSPNVTLSYANAVVNHEIELKDLSIHPNPTNSILTIETELTDHYLIDIRSMNGQLIYNTKMEGTSHQIDLSSFQKGVYFITIRSKEFVTTRKIVKL